MTRRICEDAPATSVGAQQRGAEVEDLILSFVEVRDVHIRMKLLRMRTVRPLWRAVVIHVLKGEHETGAKVQSRKVIAD